MTREYDQANALQRLLRRFAASGPGAWLFARVLHHVDRPFYRLTRGRWTFASLVSGIPVVMLTTPGAKSGRQRTVPVLGPTYNTSGTATRPCNSESRPTSLLQARVSRS